MGTSAPAPFGTPQRTPVVFDADTSGLRIGAYEQRVDDPSEPTSVYSAYLSLLYAVRGARPGERLALRSADLDALLLLVGDDPDTIEQRLVGLMGCTPEEASILGGLLLRHRRTTVALGLAAGLALGAGVMATGDDAPAAAPVDVPAVAVEPFTGPRATPELLQISGTTQPAPTSLAPAAVAAPPTSPVTLAPAKPVRAALRVAPPAAAPAAVPAPVEPAPAAAAAPAPPAVEPEMSTYVLPLYEDPVLDAPPPAEGPDADIGEPAVLLPDVPLTEIGGVTDSAPLVVEEPAPADAPLDLPPVEVLLEELPPATDASPAT